MFQKLKVEEGINNSFSSDIILKLWASLYMSYYRDVYIAIDLNSKKDVILSILGLYNRFEFTG
jgi:hypothetical protein